MKIWKTSTADTKFSELVRLRDSRCMRCSSKDNLQCSHYFGRDIASTRYDLRNGDTLCYHCHYGDIRCGWENHKQCCYRAYMIKKLGEDGYHVLLDLSHKIENGDLPKYRKKFQKEYKELKKEILNEKLFSR